MTYTKEQRLDIGRRIYDGEITKYLCGDVDAEYNAGRVRKNKKASVERIRHKKFGEGAVVERKGEFIVVNFVSVGRKQLNLKVCQDKGLMEFV